MNILDILKRYSDAEHQLRQRDIIDILHDEYEMEADRKAIDRNLMDLIVFTRSPEKMRRLPFA